MINIISNKGLPAIKSWIDNLLRLREEEEVKNGGFRLIAVHATNPNNTQNRGDDDYNDNETLASRLMKMEQSRNEKQECKKGTGSSTKIVTSTTDKGKSMVGASSYKVKTMTSENTMNGGSEPKMSNTSQEADVMTRDEFGKTLKGYVIMVHTRMDVIDDVISEIDKEIEEGLMVYPRAVELLELRKERVRRYGPPSPNRKSTRTSPNTKMKQNEYNVNTNEIETDVMHSDKPNEDAEGEAINITSPIPLKTLVFDAPSSQPSFSLGIPLTQENKCQEIILSQMEDIEMDALMHQITQMYTFGSNACEAPVKGLITHDTTLGSEHSISSTVNGANANNISMMEERQRIW